MNRIITRALAASLILGVIPAVTQAQGVEQDTAIASSDVLSQISMFSYRERPKSDLFLRGTPVAENATGEARVEYQDGNAEILAKVQDLPQPASLGPYTGYVLWAVTPDGRAVNQGVLAGPAGGKGKMKTQHGASQFALIVTAEPHFAVTVPSTMIVLYNVADDVKGDESKVTTLTERADYSRLMRIAIDDTNSTQVVQARYSIAIARAAGAERFAPQAYALAGQKLAAAETAMQGKRRSERRTAPGLAREAVTAGEDARRAAMLASAAADSEAQRVASARAATNAANRSAAIATTAATAAATAATDRATAAAAAATETERLRTTAATAAAAAATRADLRNRLNAALPTRATDRGLVSEIGGVEFATGAAGVNASARENLSKFSGVVASYPDLRIAIEGHTDITGSIATNNDLSLRRAMTVRDYLIAQGVTASSIEVAGFGSSMPTADNATVDGRARNRRVAIVLSGGPLSVN
jgi:outer membrane protein OmpA-like peptidoglycan-associated protein